MFEKINKKEKDNEKRFEYSPENPPSLEILEEKIFCIHTTSFVPEDGILKPWARDISHDNKWKGEEQPSFRPTIHFSLGEIVPSHSDFNWEDEEYAIIIPLKEIKDKIINLFPHDTFTLGEIDINKEEVILIVPENADISKLPNNTRIIRYKKEVGIRESVDSLIRKESGWKIEMKEGDVTIDSTAEIKGVDINDKNFFQNFLEEYPHTSFGVNSLSEKGEAFRFGLIEWLIVNISRNYSDSYLRYSTSEILFFKSLITHHLEKAEKFIETLPDKENAKKYFLEKKEKLFKWLNIVDCDLYLREKYGKSLSGAPEGIQDIFRQNKDNTEKLKNTADSIFYQLPNEKKEKIEIDVLVDVTYSMSLKELEEFKKKNEIFFENCNIDEFYFRYIINRWLVMGLEEIKKEGGYNLLCESLEKIDERIDIFQYLKGYLKVGYKKFKNAIEILQDDKIKKYLEDKFNLSFPDNSPKNLAEIILVHPKTKILFEDETGGDNFFEKEEYLIISKIENIEETIFNPEDFQSFSDAVRSATNKKMSKKFLIESMNCLNQPLKTVNKHDKSKGTQLTFYEILKRDQELKELWRKLGLEKEFKEIFPSDNLFWNSEKSFMEVYKILNNRRS